MRGSESSTGQTHLMFTERATATEALFGAISPLPLVVYRASVDATGDGLLPQEKAQTTTMAPRRKANFAAGRRAAAAALTMLGCPRQPLLSGPNGAPVWPADVIGSIAHTDRVAYVVAALAGPDQAEVSVGIDVEDRGRIGPDLVPLIMTEPEAAAWARLDGARADVFATMTFGAKEAFYKAQFPLTASWLGFENARLVDLRPAPNGWSEITDVVVADVEIIDQPDLDRELSGTRRVASLVSPDLVVSAAVLHRGQPAVLHRRASPAPPR